MQNISRYKQQNGSLELNMKDVAIIMLDSIHDLKPLVHVGDGTTEMGGGYGSSDKEWSEKRRAAAPALATVAMAAV